MLSILFENLERFSAVWMHEVGERLKQRKHHEVDESHLRSVGSVTAQQKYLRYESIRCGEL